MIMEDMILRLRERPIVSGQPPNLLLIFNSNCFLVIILLDVT